jgi:hypothetical protein
MPRHICQSSVRWGIEERAEIEIGRGINHHRGVIGMCTSDALSALSGTNRPPYSARAILLPRGETPLMKGIPMNLSAPTMIVFIISLVIAALGVLAALGIFSVIPLASVWIMTIAYAVLLAGVLLKGV